MGGLSVEYGSATPTSDAAHAGATTISALTLKMDPVPGAGHLQEHKMADLAARRHLIATMNDHYAPDG